MHITSGSLPSPTNRHIYLDMDGVLCDLPKALLALHDRMDLLDKLDSHDIEPMLGMTTMETWLPVVDAGWAWWDGIEPFPWTFELWAWAHKVAGEVFVLTRPLMLDQLDARDVGYTVRGKMSWIRRHFGRKFRKIVFTAEKYVVSQPGVVLVDDDERYEASFLRRGGDQIVFPRSYNRFRMAQHAPMDSVRAQYQLLRS